jgi:hypothetical protein
MVSNKDREAAWEIIVKVRDAAPRAAEDADSMDIVDALVSHGWGPKPTVDPVIIRSWKPDEIIQYLCECGIEVTDA